MLDTSVGYVKAFLRSTSLEKIDILTNGLQKASNYEQLIPFKDRIHRVGFTWHRKVLHGVKHQYERYCQNVMLLHNAGIPVYVKELLFTELREEIREAKRFWKERGVTYKIQDFKGEKRGRDFEEWTKYTDLDWYLVDAEYKRGGEECACFKGYRNVIIRGGWNDGDVLACFEDPVVVGNIQRNEFHPCYQILKDFQKGHITVLGVDQTYRGRRDRDVYDPNAKEAEDKNGYDLGRSIGSTENVPLVLPLTKDDLRLKELSETSLFVRSDARSHIKDMPKELVEGSYRWRVYIYSNLFRDGGDKISPEDKDLFVRVSQGFLIQHMNPWSRVHASEFDLERIKELRTFVLEKIAATESFYELRVCLYVWAAARKGDYICDEYMLEMCPGLAEYVSR